MTTPSATPVNLGGVPETMLWTLYNRASEAMRPDALLHDPDAVRVFRSIDYDYARSFGRPDGSHAMRSLIFDRAVRGWLAVHRGGSVIELAAGLETQFQRCDDGTVHWLCVDLPEAIATRQRYLPASDRCRHLAASALDPVWLDQIQAREVFITAQGLFMYFEPAQVEALFAALMARFERIELVFDAIPRWFSRMTVAGWHKTPHYRVPPMPWGANRGELAALLRRWSTHVATVELQPYGFLRGIGGALLPLVARTPFLREMAPTIVRVCGGTAAA